MQYEIVFEIWIDDSSPSSTQQITFALHCIFLKKEYSKASFKLVLKKGRVKKICLRVKVNFLLLDFFFRGQTVWSNYFSLLQPFVFWAAFLRQCSVDILTGTVYHYNILPIDYLSRIWPNFDQTI